jgi:transcriptional regulator with XRE-family HTH domain
VYVFNIIRVSVFVNTSFRSLENNFLDIVERVFELLKKNSMTAKDLSDETGIPQSTITEWKKSRSKPSTDALKKLSEYFNVTTDYLLGMTDKPNRLIVHDDDGNNIGWASVVNEAVTSGLTPEDLKAFIDAANKANRKKK